MKTAIYKTTGETATVGLNDNGMVVAIRWGIPERYLRADIDACNEGHELAIDDPDNLLPEPVEIEAAIGRGATLLAVNP